MLGANGIPANGACPPPGAFFILSQSGERPGTIAGTLALRDNALPAQLAGVPKPRPNIHSVHLG